MNILRRFVSSENGFLSIPIPKEFQKTKLEVIIFPFDNGKKTVKNQKLIAKAHEIIDRGCDVENIDEFFDAFENSRKDRELPNRG